MRNFYIPKFFVFFAQRILNSLHIFANNENTSIFFGDKGLILFLHLIGVLQLQDINYIKIYVINPKHIHLSPFNFQSKEGICLVLGKTFICKVSFFNTKIVNCLITML